MKRELLLAVLVVCLFTAAAKCSDFLSIENRGDATVQANRIIQDLIVKSRGGGVTTLSVMPLDNEIVNLQNPNIKIPISNLYVSSKESSHQLNYGKLTTAIGNSPLNSLENIKLIVENTGYLQAGVYSTRLEFKNTGINDSAVSVYVLSVNVPKEQEIFSDTGDVFIKVSGNKVFTPNLSVVNEANPKISVKSNIPWSVYLDTFGMNRPAGGSDGKYYFKIKSKSSEVTEFEEHTMLLEPNKRYWLASGSPTKGARAYVQIEYSHKNTESKYSKPGIVDNAFKYIIEEKKS